MSPQERIQRFRLQIEALRSWPDDEIRAYMIEWCQKKIQTEMNRLPA